MCDRPADDAGAFHLTLLTLDGAFAPECIEQRQQRKAENGEIVAVDLFEQLNSEPLELIGADRAKNLFARGGEVSPDELRGQRAHGQRRGLAISPGRYAVAGKG